MMEWLIELNAYHWLGLGLILFAAEALGAAGFLLGAAAAAIALGILTLAVPDLTGATQLSLYALVALVATVLYLKVFREAQDDHPDELNHRSAGLVGHEFELTEPLSGGEGRVQIGDTLWRVSSEKPLEPGTRVRVVAADAMSLQISAS
jgi:membrane protein implicated in regulation of membrane protease activity